MKNESPLFVSVTILELLVFTSWRYVQSVLSRQPLSHVSHSNAMAAQAAQQPTEISVFQPPFRQGKDHTQASSSVSQYRSNKPPAYMLPNLSDDESILQPVPFLSLIHI